MFRRAFPYEQTFLRMLADSSFEFCNFVFFLLIKRKDCILKIIVFVRFGWLSTSCSVHDNDSLQYFPFLETVKKTAAFTSNESKKVKALRNSKNERKHILSKPLNNLLSKNRHSSRIRVPNSRFDYLLPGFLEQSGNGSGSGKRRDNMEKNRRSKKCVYFRSFE